MPLENYGVLKARPIARRFATHANAHYQVHLIDLHEDTDYRVAINVKSQLSPSELEYLFIDHYQHPILAELPDLPLGFTPIARQPGGIALDFIRGNLFDPAAMQPLPFEQPGQNNDLNELLDAHMQPALADSSGCVRFRNASDSRAFARSAFGSPWVTRKSTNSTTSPVRCTRLRS